jgi:hypothetical protein
MAVHEETAPVTLVDWDIVGVRLAAREAGQQQAGEQEEGPSS